MLNKLQLIHLIKVELVAFHGWVAIKILASKPLRAVLKPRMRPRARLPKVWEEQIHAINNLAWESTLKMKIEGFSSIKQKKINLMKLWMMRIIGRSLNKNKMSQRKSYFLLSQVFASLSKEILKFVISIQIGILPNKLLSKKMIISSKYYLPKTI